MKIYKIDNVKSVLDADLSIFNRKVKPMIVAIRIGIVLDEQSVTIGLFFVFESTQQVSTLKLRVKLKHGFT